MNIFVQKAIIYILIYEYIVNTFCCNYLRLNAIRMVPLPFWVIWDNLCRTVHDFAPASRMQYTTLQGLSLNIKVDRVCSFRVFAQTTAYNLTLFFVLKFGRGSCVEVVACGRSLFILSNSVVGIWFLFGNTRYGMLVFWGSDSVLFSWILPVLRDSVLKWDSDHPVTFVFGIHSFWRLNIVKNDAMACLIDVCRTTSIVPVWTDSFAVLLMLTDVTLTRLVEACAGWLT